LKKKAFGCAPQPFSSLFTVASSQVWLLATLLTAAHTSAVDSFECEM
jgi:hypothetical protein